MTTLLKNQFLKLSLGFFLFLQIFNVGQAKASQPLDTLDILSKVDYILDNSNKYKEFKVVKKTWIIDLKSQIADSLEVTAAEIARKKTTIESQKSEIETLKQTIAETKAGLIDANSAKDKISLLGMSLDKGSYNGIMFSTIILLALLLVIFIIRFKSSNKVTQDTKKNYSSLDDEFEQYKKNTLEKEQKLKRQLQDEINKNNKLSNNN